MRQIAHLDTQEIELLDVNRLLAAPLLPLNTRQAR
jgi:hypothetical protein